MRDCSISVAKTKTLISCAVTAQLFCAFVFAYVKFRFSHDAAHFSHDWAEIFYRIKHNKIYNNDDTCCMF